MDVIGRVLGIDRSIVRRRCSDEAIVVVPGLTISAMGRRAMARFLLASPYDVFFVDYTYGRFLHRRSLDGAVASLLDRLDAYALERYARIHVYANILGGWAFNLAQRRRPLANLASAVYDRSPLQERADSAVTSVAPASIRAIFGSVVEDMAATPYPPLDRPDVRVGLVIEDRASLLLKVLRWRADRMGPYRFEADAFAQRYDDALHLPLSHDGIYTGIGSFGPALLHFFRKGRFPDEVRREPYPGDPFAWHVPWRRPARGPTDPAR